jgi:hypothetical protein
MLFSNPFDRNLPTIQDFKKHLNWHIPSQGTGSGGQSEAQIQSVGKGVEHALDKLTVSGDRG